MKELAEVLNKLNKLDIRITELTNTIKADRMSELNVQEAAAFLGVKPKTVHNYLAANKLVGFKKGKFRYFYKSELEDFRSIDNNVSMTPHL